MRFRELRREVNNELIDLVLVAIDERGAVKRLAWGRTPEEAANNFDRVESAVLPGEFVGGRIASAFGYGVRMYYNEVAQRFQEMVDRLAGYEVSG
jgi:hypothetical protein